jgi:DNA replication and repair protein RecF
MGLAQLALEDVRCLQQAELELDPESNVLWGDNGSGKTSVLEAIFLLGRGRSFRTRNSVRLIRHGASRLRITGRTIGALPAFIGIEVSKLGGTVAKLRGEYVPSLAELSRAFAVQVIEPGAHKLIEEGAQRRRRWLDWAVFHVEPTFIDAWTRYGRALKQRNTALRSGRRSGPDEAAVWDAELAKQGQIVASLRETFVERLQPHWSIPARELTGLDVEIRHSRGWSSDLSLAEALHASLSRDIAQGVTHVGPHRGDVLVRLDRGLARDTLSRGQQKLVAAAMTLSQLSLVRELTGTSPTLLLDDPAAELDRDRLHRLAGQIQQLQCQLVITSLLPEIGPFGRAGRVFHVEHNSVRLVSSSH